MPTDQVELSDQELELVQDVQARLGFETIEETLEYLLSERLRERLLAIAGREVIKQQNRR